MIEFLNEHQNIADASQLTTANGWVNWHGGKCPVLPDQKVELCIVVKDTEFKISPMYQNGIQLGILAGGCMWEHYINRRTGELFPGTIIKYRLVNN